MLRCPLILVSIDFSNNSVFDCSYHQLDSCLENEYYVFSVCVGPTLYICCSSVVPLSLAVPLIRSTSCTLLHFLSSSSSAWTCIWGHWEYLQVCFLDPHSSASFVPKALYQVVCLVHVPVFELKAKIHVQGFAIIQQSGNSAFLFECHWWNLSVSHTATVHGGIVLRTVVRAGANSHHCVHKHMGNCLNCFESVPPTQKVTPAHQQHGTVSYIGYAPTGTQAAAPPAVAAPVAAAGGTPSAAFYAYPRKCICLLVYLLINSLNTCYLLAYLATCLLYRADSILCIRVNSLSSNSSMWDSGRWKLRNVIINHLVRLTDQILKHLLKFWPLVLDMLKPFQNKWLFLNRVQSWVTLFGDEVLNLLYILNSSEYSGEVHYYEMIHLLSIL